MDIKPGDYDSSERGSPSDEHRKTPYEYQQYGTDTVDVSEAQHYSDPKDKDHSLHRGLSSRQISMIAIGGAIGMSEHCQIKTSECRKY